MFCNKYEDEERCIHKHAFFSAKKKKIVINFKVRNFRGSLVCSWSWAHVYIKNTDLETPQRPCRGDTFFTSWPLTLYKFS